jgi:uncharacterized protein (TIGR02722 family)
MRTTALVMICTTLMLGACTNTIKYDAASRPASVQTEFNVTDLQSMAGSMVDNMLTHPSVLSYTLAKRPSLALDPLVNLTGRDIGVNAASQDVLEKLMTSDSFRLVDAGSVKAARSKTGLSPNQSIDDKALAWSMARSLNADLLLFGEVSEVIRSKATAKDVFYRVDLRLLDRKTGGIAWQDQKEFLKSQKKNIYGL